MQIRKATAYAHGSMWVTSHCNMINTITLRKCAVAKGNYICLAILCISEV